MAGGELHLLNARLPLAADDGWYELRAANGRWTSVTRHAERVVAPDALPFERFVETLSATGDGTRMEAGMETEMGASGAGVASLAAASGNDAATVDLNGKLAVPGFVDMHLHLDKALTIDRIGNFSGTLIEAIANYGSQYTRFSQADIRDRIVRTALMGLRCGTTRMRTHLDIPVGAGRELTMRTVSAALEAKEALRGLVRVQLFPMLDFAQRPAAMAELAKELITLGMDGLGGCPHLSSDPEADIRLLFETAARLDVPLDLHVDERDDPRFRTIEPITRRTAEYGYGGRVTAGHLCSLSSMPSAEAEPIMAAMAQAGVGAVTLPAANLYLQGREDDGPVRRGVTRVGGLLAAGVNVAAASDNIRDPFHPFGRGDLPQIALLAAYAAHLGGSGDADKLLRMITEAPAALMGQTDYGIREGYAADVVVLDAADTADLLNGGAPSRYVAVGGRWVSAVAQRDIRTPVVV